MTIREKTSLTLTILFGAFFVGGLAYGWTSPASNPPNGNVEAPLNAGAGTQTKSGALTVSGILTTGSDLVLSGNNVFRRNTSDGSDSGRIDISGGGASGNTRGGLVRISGNENADPGRVILWPGNVTNSGVYIETAGGSDALTVSGANGVISSPTQYRVSARSGTGVQSLSNGVNTAVEFTAEDFDIGGFHSNVSNTHVFTVPSGGDGVYLLIGTVMFAANTTNGRYVWWDKSGTTISTIASGQGASGASLGITATAVVSLSAGDSIGLVAWQNSGSSLNIGQADGDRRFQNAAQIIKLW